MEVGIMALAAGIAVGLPALGTGWAQSKIGSAGIAGLVEKPEMTGTVIIMLAIPETMAILGFVVAVLIMLQAGG